MTQLNPILQALIATCFTWAMTAAGAGGAFFVRQVNQKVLDLMLGFAAGVMIAASYWSLLAPAIELSAEIGGTPPWLPAAVGFLLGGAFLRLVDYLLPHLHLDMQGAAEGLKTTWKRSVLLVLAITLHNFPEGLAVGVAFGAIYAGYPSASLGAAIALAVGIGLQNLPEGLAVSMPLRREGLSRWRSFLFGQLSGAVEPFAVVLGASAVFLARLLLSYALAFAAGAMIYVVIEELVPESQSGGHSDIATVGSLLGFVIMMVLDVALS